MAVVVVGWMMTVVSIMVMVDSVTDGMVVVVVSYTIDVLVEAGRVTVDMVLAAPMQSHADEYSSTLGQMLAEEDGVAKEETGMMDDGGTDDASDDGADDDANNLLTTVEDDTGGCPPHPRSFFFTCCEPASFLTNIYVGATVVAVRVVTMVVVNAVMVS